MKVDKQLIKAKKLLKQGNKTDAANLFMGILRTYPMNKQAQQGLRQAQADAVPQLVQQLLGLFNQGQFQQTIQLADNMLNQFMTEAVVYNVKAAALVSLGRPKAAIPCFKQVIKQHPDNLDVYINITGALVATKANEEALTYANKAVALAPKSAKAWYNLAVVAGKNSDVLAAIEANRKAFALAPEDINIINNLGAMLNDSKQYQEAYEVLSKGLAGKQSLDLVVSNRALSLVKLGRWQEALQEYQKVDNNTDLSAYYLGYSELLIELKRYAEAIALLGTSLDNCPFNHELYQNYLMAQCYCHERGQAATRKVANTYCEQLASALPLQAPTLDRRGDEKLKIGYFSPDFRNHSVAQFFEPLLANHSDKVEIYCYYNWPNSDQVTERLQAKADHWRDVAMLSDEQLVQMVQDDGVHILLDLAGHTSGGRLTLFAQKPAPIQVSWLGYPDTTGLTSIDYRLVDNITDPEGQEEDYYSEQLVRMPRTFLSYQGKADLAPSVDLPADSNQYVTFGSFNNLNKLTKQVISSWAEIVKQVHNSRLLLKAAQFHYDEPTEQYYQWFEELGISRDRVELIGRTDTVEEHLALYSRVDLCLDAYPYNGTTTSCEALWMGVPVVTLTGQRHVGRVTTSILHNIGLPELAAPTEQAYIETAANLATDLDQLRELRQGMRQRMLDSELCNHVKFAQEMEAVYQKMWQNYIETSDS